MNKPSIPQPYQGINSALILIITLLLQYIIIALVKQCNNNVNTESSTSCFGIPHLTLLKNMARELQQWSPLQTVTTMKMMEYTQSKSANKFVWAKCYKMYLNHHKNKANVAFSLPVAIWQCLSISIQHHSKTIILCNQLRNSQLTRGIIWHISLNTVCKMKHQVAQ